MCLGIKFYNNNINLYAVHKQHSFSLYFDICNKFILENYKMACKEKVCLNCGNVFVGNGCQKYCCPECQKEARKRKKKEWDHKYYQTHKDTTIAEYKAKNRDQILRKKKEYREREDVKEYIRKQYKEYTDRLKIAGIYSQKRRESRERNKEKNKATQKNICGKK